MDRRVSTISKYRLSEVVGRWKWLQLQPRVATKVVVLGISVSLLFSGVPYDTIFCMAPVDFDRQCACESSTVILTEVEVVFQPDNRILREEGESSLVKHHQG